MRSRLGALGVLVGAIVAGCFSGASGPQDGATGDGGGGGVDALIPDAAAPSSCVVDEAPGEGIYVSATHGDDDAGDGTPLRPYLTLTAAIDAAAALGQATIYVEEGTYPESITIRPSTAGVTLRGGWVSAGTVWSRTCPPGVVSRTVIAPTDDPIAVHVEGAVTASGLELLTIATKAQGASAPDTSGETVIGVHVTGAGASFALTDVDVLMGDGGAASMGDAGALGGTYPECVGGAGCSTGARGGDGEPTGPASVGTFDLAGYVPGDGAPGAPGDHGRNGTNPTVGPQSRSDCQQDCTCDGGSCHDPTGNSTVTAAPGRCGCGGGGGGGGRPGRGGGASFAIYVDGDGATVGVTRGRLVAGAGGDGSRGGAGGEGAGGSDGIPGGNANCNTGCATGGGPCSSCYNAYPNTLLGGGAGGVGGVGGTGGAGGNGAGGPSFVMVERAGGRVLINGAVVVPGAAGRGAGEGDLAAPGGEAGTRFTLP